MPLSNVEANNLLIKARTYIGKSYADIDCSHFVWAAYKDSGKEYPYRSTATFDELVTLGYFQKLSPLTTPQEADVILMKGHVGIWDSKGCEVLMTNAECKKLQNNAPFLSSRTSNNRGPDFGQLKWFGKITAVYRWNKK